MRFLDMVAEFPVSFLAKSFKTLVPHYDQSSASQNQQTQNRDLDPWAEWDTLECVDGKKTRERCNSYSNNGNCMARERQRKSC